MSKVKILGRIKEFAYSSYRTALWRREKGLIDPRSIEFKGAISRVLVIASDPGEVVGSRGDDAMFGAVIQAIRKRNPGCEIGVVSVNAPLPQFLDSAGLKAVPIWNGHSYRDFLVHIESYDALVMIGADVMDGHYSSSNAVRFWAMCDLAARRGLRTFVLGCSFSNDISTEVVRVIRELTPKLTVFARDRVSKEKFDAIAATPAELVADSAFTLAPTDGHPDLLHVRNWARLQRAAGRFVCALNVHPMIFKGWDMGRVHELNDALARLLPPLLQKYQGSLLLVPHDFRDGGLGDNNALAPLFELLGPTLGDRVMFSKSEARAADLKGLIGEADLLITGRMHLGVGALSMGVAMYGLSPQDKFIGLFEHFGLPDLRITPDQARDEIKLQAFLEDALSGWAIRQKAIREALPAVKTLAESNFRLLD